MALVCLLAAWLSGPARSSGSTISPDGKMTAIDGGASLVVRGDKAPNGLTVPASDGAHDPAWSPDGNYLAFAAGSGAGAHGGIFNLKTGRTAALPLGFGSPYAWREDSLRIAGINTLEDGSVEVAQYHVTERGMTLTTALPGVRSVARAFWVAQTDDVVVQTGTGDVYLVESGQVTSISQSHDVIGLGITPDGSTLVWARRSANPRYILCSLYQFNMKTRSVVRLPFPARVAGVNPDPRTGPTRVDCVWFSADARRLAVVGAQPVGTAVATTVYVTNLAGTTARLVAKVSGDPAVTVNWSDDGRQLICTLVTGGRATHITASGDGANAAPPAK